MAEHKRSFVLYADIIHTVQHLSTSDAGELFLHILSYVNDENPETDNNIVKIAFEPIKQQLKRDLLKWGEIREKRSEAGKISANKRQQVSTSVESVEQTSTNSTVSVNANVTVINSKERLETFERFWDFYKKGSKKVSKERFLKLSDADIELIRLHLPAYFKANPEVKYRKDAERYLSNRLWENGDIELLVKKVELPINWFNSELTKEQWALLTPAQRMEKENNDTRKQMGI